MSSKETRQTTPSEDTRDVARDETGPEDESGADDASKTREIGGRKGPDPTRYGDWEKAGRCIDF